MLSQGNLSANVSQMLPGTLISIPKTKSVGDSSLLSCLRHDRRHELRCCRRRANDFAAPLRTGQTLATINKKKPTIFPAVPTIYAAINQSPDLSKFDLSTVRFCISGGAPLPLEVKETFERLTGCRLVEGYGLSETAPVATCNAMADTNKPGSIGQVMPGTEISIHDLKPRMRLCLLGSAVKSGQGPQVMRGYPIVPKKRPTACAMVGSARVTWGAWTMRVTFPVDRLKDLILCSGYNVYPRMVEEAIYLHPSVAEVTVIGIDDEYRGQSPKAFVKLKDGERLTESEMKSFLEGKLSKIEMPSEVEFRLELPKPSSANFRRRNWLQKKREATGICRLMTTFLGDMLTITELAREAGVTAGNPFYESKGLLTPRRAGTTGFIPIRSAGVCSLSCAANVLVSVLPISANISTCMTLIPPSTTRLCCSWIRSTTG